MADPVIFDCNFCKMHILKDILPPVLECYLV